MTASPFPLSRALAFAGLLAATLVAATSISPATAAPQTGQSRRAIWDTAANRLIPLDDFMQRAAAADFILLGETHDNASHHAIQAEVIQGLISRGRRPALVLEQYDTVQQSELDRVVQETATSEDKLRRLLGSMGPGWDKNAYAGILRVGIDAALPLIAGNLSRSSAREISRNGPDAARQLGFGDLMLDAVWDEAKERATRAAIQEGHCGMLPESAVRGMAIGQRARDAVLAQRLLEQSPSGAVAIIGRGHVLKTTAVPLYLRARKPKADVLSVGLLETEAQDNGHPVPPSEPGRSALAAEYDYVWLTPAAARDGDPCDAFKQPPPPASGPPPAPR